MSFFGKLFCFFWTLNITPDYKSLKILLKLDADGCTGAPDLVIEILSPSTFKKDLNDKYSIYEESGVSEYWIVMPNEKLVVILLRSRKV